MLALTGSFCCLLLLFFSWQRKPKAVLDEDGFTMLVPRDEHHRSTKYSEQDIVGMG